MEIAILLTTYNSSAFLQELLVSLQEQTYDKWNLYIHDDISTDNTLEIINRFTSTDNRMHLLNDNCKRGAMGGFMWLLEQVNADYYMFCDHDDIWKKNKIELTLNKMLEAETINELPIIVHTDLEVVDTYLKTLKKSFWQAQHFKEKEFNNKYYHLVYNNVTGCTMMINNKTKEIALPIHPYAKMHDSWITTAVLWNKGKVLNVYNQTILYRQHGKNTIGVNELPTISNKIHRIKELIKKTNRSYKVAKHFANINIIIFWMLKLYYMTSIYIRNEKNNL